MFSWKASALLASNQCQSLIAIMLGTIKNYTRKDFLSNEVFIFVAGKWNEGAPGGLFNGSIESTGCGSKNGKSEHHFSEVLKMDDEDKLEASIRNELVIV